MYRACQRTTTLPIHCARNKVILATSEKGLPRHDILDFLSFPIRFGFTGQIFVLSYVSHIMRKVLVQILIESKIV
jgi:hypothetical protein